MQKALSYHEIRPDLEAYLKMATANRQPITLVLDQVHNKRNLAGIFRLAEAARLAEVILYRCGIDPQSDHKVQKVARSTPQYLPQRSFSALSELTALAQTHHLVALEITNQSIPYFEYQAPTPLALVVGNEQKGISPEVLALCQDSIHVPMLGRNSSMNVAMATGIATYGLLREMGQLG